MDRRNRRAKEAECPICLKMVSKHRIQEHVEDCLTKYEKQHRPPKQPKRKKDSSSGGAAAAKQIKGKRRPAASLSSSATSSATTTLGKAKARPTRAKTSPHARSSRSTPSAGAQRVSPRRRRASTRYYEDDDGDDDDDDDDDDDGEGEAEEEEAEEEEEEKEEEKEEEEDTTPRAPVGALRLNIVRGHPVYPMEALADDAQALAAADTLARMRPLLSYVRHSDSRDARNTKRAIAAEAAAGGGGTAAAAAMSGHRGAASGRGPSSSSSSSSSAAAAAAAATTTTSSSSSSAAAAAVAARNAAALHHLHSSKPFQPQPRQAVAAVGATPPVVPEGAASVPLSMFAVQRRPTKAMAKAYVRRFLAGFKDHPDILDDFFQILRQSRAAGAHAEDVALRVGQLYFEVQRVAPKQMPLALEFSQFLPADVNLTEYILPHCSTATARQFIDIVQERVSPARFQDFLQTLHGFRFSNNPSPEDVAKVLGRIVSQLTDNEQLLEKLVRFIPKEYVKGTIFRALKEEQGHSSNGNHNTNITVKSDPTTGEAVPPGMANV